MRSETWMAPARESHPSKTASALRTTGGERTSPVNIWTRRSLLRAKKGIQPLLTSGGSGWTQPGCAIGLVDGTLPSWASMFVGISSLLRSHGHEAGCCFWANFDLFWRGLCYFHVSCDTFMLFPALCFTLLRGSWKWCCMALTSTHPKVTCKARLPHNSLQSGLDNSARTATGHSRRLIRRLVVLPKHFKAGWLKVKPFGPE